MTSPNILKVVVVGANHEMGNILSYLVAKGDVFGYEQRMDLVLVENLSKLPSLRRGVNLELGMCDLKLVNKQSCTHKLDDAFRDADVIFLASGIQPGPGLSRNDMIGINGLEYKEIGLALERVAKETVRILVITEPQNTNLMILNYFAPSVKPHSLTGLSRVDHNRALTMIARMLNISSDKVKHVTMWGNRSQLIFPDIRHAQVEVMGKTYAAYDAIKDDFFLKYKFVDVLHNREADILKKRKTNTTALTIATAAAQHMKDWMNGTKPDDWTSMIVLSDGSYGIEKGLAYSFPVKVTPPGEWKIVQDLDINYYEREKLDERAVEIKRERLFAYNVLELPEAKTEMQATEEGESAVDQARAASWSFGHHDPIPCKVLGPIEQERLGNM